MSNADGNAYDWGAKAGKKAGRAFGGMKTMAGVPSMSDLGPVTGNTIDHIDTYMNPYQANVIADSQANAARMNQIMQGQNDAQADAAGAFGGARHGLTGATIASDIARDQGYATNQLLNQGWNTSADLAAGHVGQDMAQGRDLANLQGQDIANMFRLNQQNNSTLLNQGNAYRGVAKDLYAQGDASATAQAAAGSAAQKQTQAAADAAAAIFDGNNPESVLTNLQNALTGSPLTGEGTQTGSRTPSGMEKASMFWGTLGDMAGK